MENSSKIFYAALTLFVIAVLMGGMMSNGPEGLAFGFFTVLTLGGSLICIFERSVVRSAFALMATFTGVAGFFLLLGADFLAMAQILIYVGGILALLLFGVMLAPPDMKERKLPRVGVSFALIGIGVLWVGMRVKQTIDPSGTVWATVAAEDLPEPVSHSREIGIGFVDPLGYLLAFELAAFFLTVALVAAVYIARRRRADLVPEGNA